MALKGCIFDFDGTLGDSMWVWEAVITEFFAERAVELDPDAMAQLAQLTVRMETEAQCEACLREMGYEGAYAVSGAQLLTLLIPYDKIKEESDKTRILDAVCGISGLDAGSVKIILTKK